MPSKNSPNKPKPKPQQSAAGANAQSIQWISADYNANQPFVTVDKQRRIYFSAGARAMFEGTDAVVVGYDHANKRLIIGDSATVRPTDVKPMPFDARRHYVSARPLVAALGFDYHDLPLRYKYAGKDYASAKGAHAFELTDDALAGGDGGA